MGRDVARVRLVRTFGESLINVISKSTVAAHVLGYPEHGEDKTSDLHVPAKCPGVAPRAQGTELLPSSSV